MKISPEDVRSYLDVLGTAALETIGGNAAFTATLDGNRIIVTPESGTPRGISMSNLRRVLDIYNASGSTRTTDYTDATQNSSYLLAIIVAASKGSPAPTAGRRVAKVFVFWTEYTADVSQWLGAELLEGRLRQGWGLREMSLVDRSGQPLDFDVWHRDYVTSARKAGWKEEDLTERSVQNRHRILLRMLEIESGDLLVIPRKPGRDELAFALAAGRYQFKMAEDQEDFGHVIPIASGSLKVAARDASAVAGIAGDLPNYRSAVSAVRQDTFAQQLWRVYAELGGAVATGTSEEPDSPYADADNTPPVRVPTTIQRIVRDTAKGRALKAHYGQKCQVCDTSIRLPGRSAGYVEVHHLVPLGEPHNGNDDWNNMVVVCPNCHVAFDFGAYRLNAATLRLHTPDGEREMKFISGHRLSRENLERHWRLPKP